MTLGRTTATHLMTVTRDSESDATDAYGTPLTSDTTETVLADEPVRYFSPGTEISRGGIGSEVIEEPVVRATRPLAETIQEGDTIDLTPISEGVPELTGLEVTGIDTGYGLGSRPIRTRIEVT